MQQPRGAEQWVGESSQPTHTGPNEFAMRADVSTNVNVGGTGRFENYVCFSLRKVYIQW